MSAATDEEARDPWSKVPVSEDIELAGHIQGVLRHPDRLFTMTIGDRQRIGHTCSFTIDPEDQNASNVLCARGRGVPFVDWMVRQERPFSVTTDVDTVDCSDCLEWMHS